MQKDILYLIRYQNIPQYVKIGITNNLEKRIQSLNTGCPTKIEVLFHHPFPKQAQILEKHYHQKYQRQQSNLEWFEISPEETQQIVAELINLSYRQNQNKN